MRRSTAVRISVIGLVLAPLMTACSTAPWTSGQDGTSRESATAGTGGVLSGPRTKVAVPAESSIRNFEILKVQSHEDRETGYGEIVGIATMTNDHPVMIDLRLELLDASGRVIAENTSLNSNYSVGTNDIVLHSLIEMPKGAKPKSFRVSLIKAMNMGDEHVVTTFGKPSLGTSTKVADVPALKGTVTFRGAPPNGHSSHGACVTPDGRVHSGSGSMNDLPERAGAGGSTVADYEIPLYDADGVDLSKAVCFASA